LNAAKGKNYHVCSICTSNFNLGHEEAESPIQAKCKQFKLFKFSVFCREDVRQYIQTSPDLKISCPICFKPLQIDLTQEDLAPHTTGISKNKSIVNYIDLPNWRSSTKIEALIEELTSLQSQSATHKSIVFSQFVSFLDLVHWRLSRAGFNPVKLDGRMVSESLIL
jgi:DNA repair protein RAD16